MFQSKSELVLRAFLRKGPNGILNLYQRIRDEKGLPLKCGFYPTALQIETTTSCNLNCKMCEHSYLKKNAISMDLNLFKKIIEGNGYLELVNLTGIGEGLLNPDFFEMIEFAKSKNLYVWFNDNFTLMNGLNSKKMIDLGVDAIAISLDGATGKTYENIRQGAKFDAVIGNIGKFQELKKNLGRRKPKLFFVTVVMNENFHEMPKMIELAKSLGINEVFFFGVLTFNETRNLGLGNAEKPELEKAIEDAKKTAEKLKVKIMCLPELNPEKVEICTYAWTSPYIAANGDVLPCCFVTQRNNPAILDEMCMGIAGQESVEEIWNGRKYVEFRKKWLEKKIPKACINCPKVTGIY